MAPVEVFATMWTGAPRIMHDSNPDMWFTFNLHRESSFFYQAHTTKYNNPWGILSARKNVLLLTVERQSLAHSGESPSSLVPCLKLTAIMSLALPSPSHPLSRQQDIYVHTDNINIHDTPVRHREEASYGLICKTCILYVLHLKDLFFKRIKIVCF
jgi:hypothetical protein